MDAKYFRLTTVRDDDVRDEAGNRGWATALVQLEIERAMQQVRELMLYAGRKRLSLTFSARRTSLTGAAVPCGGLVVRLPEHSDPALVMVDREAGTATAAPWLLVADVQCAAEEAGLFLPPDPSSGHLCSLGGAVACNASGARSYQYGPLGDWVTALSVILASGETVHLQRGEHPPHNGFFVLPLATGDLRVPCPPQRPAGLKSAVGYGVSARPDLMELFLGSEGTLGYIAAVTVRLIPRPAIFSALAFWPCASDAVEFVAALQEKRLAGLSPMSIEWFDRRSLELATWWLATAPIPVPPAAQAALLVEQACAEEEMDDVAEAWCEALTNAGVPGQSEWSCLPRTHAQRLNVQAFRQAVPEAANSLMRARGLRKVATDLAYPRGWLRPMMATYQADLSDIPAALGPDLVREHSRRWRRSPPSSLDHAIWGHIGDNHLHVNLLPENEAEAALAQLLAQHWTRHCATSGGAISGEHGIGKIRSRMLAELMPAEHLAKLRAVKQALDPQGLLAPGNILEN